MPEKITLFSQKSPEKWFGGDISDFKSESIAHFRQNKPFQTGYVSVHLCLFTPKGQLILQKRSPKLSFDGGLWTESAGGHLTWGFEPAEVMSFESVEEIGVPLNIVPAERFFAVYPKVKPFLSVAGLAKPIGTIASELTRLHEDQKIPFFTQQIGFAGVYARAAQPLDGEVAETCFVDLQKLKSEIQKNPQNFTENFKVYFQHFETQLDDLVAFLKKIS